MAKAVLVGLGWQGKRHFEALNELGVELAGVIDLHPEKVMERFPQYPKEKISSNPRKIFNNTKPDVVIVATNASERVKVVKYCVENGVKKIFLEKPMATSLKDALEIKHLTTEAGCLVAVNHLRRFNPNYIKLKKVLDEGVIGKVEQISAQTGSVGLGNEGTHIIDKMRMCINNSDVEWVIGFIDKTGTPNPRGAQYKDPGGWGIVQFKDGTRGYIDVSEDTGIPSVMQIVGTFGKIIIEELHNNWRILARSKDDQTLPLTKILTPLHEVPVFDTLPWDVKEFTKLGLKELIFEDKTSCSLDDGIKALEAIIAFHISDSQGGVKIPLPLNEKYHSLEVNWA